MDGCCQMALFTAGIVLLLNIWGGKRSGLSTDPAKEMADVHKCMKMLRTLEPQCVLPPMLLRIADLYLRAVGIQLEGCGKWYHTR